MPSNVNPIQCWNFHEVSGEILPPLNCYTYEICNNPGITRYKYWSDGSQFFLYNPNSGRTYKVDDIGYIVSFIENCGNVVKFIHCETLRGNHSYFINHINENHLGSDDSDESDEVCDFNPYPPDSDEGDELCDFPSPVRFARNKKRTYIIPVPYVSFKKSAKCMTDKDLKLTRVAILRCLLYLERDTHRYAKIEAEIWRNHKQALIHYGIEIAKECKRRGFLDKSLRKFKILLTPGEWMKPDWVYWKLCRNSYQAYLKLQDYRRYAWKLIRWYLSTHNRLDKSPFLFIRYHWGWPSHLDTGDIEHIEHYVANRTIRGMPIQYESFYDWTVEPSANIFYAN